MKKGIYCLFLVLLACTLIACQSNQKTSKLMKKTTNKEEKKQSLSNEEDTLNLYIYDSYNVDKYLNEAIQKFESENPGTKINLIPFSSMPDVKSKDGAQTAVNDPDAKAKNDYINRVNTELMTGEGPDILAMDVLPYYRYAESGLIEDLGMYMEEDEDFKKEEYFENILNATKYKGKQYMLPVDYSFDYIVYNKKLLNDSGQKKMNQEVYTIEDLVTIGNANNDTKTKLFALLSGSGLGTSMDSSTFLFPWLLNRNYNDFVDVAEKKATFDEGTFEQLLETVKDYTDKGYIYSLNEQGKFMGADAPSSIFRLLNDSLFYQSLYPEMSYFGSISSSVGFPSPDEVVTGTLSGKEDKISFSYLAQSYAISKNSKKKKSAWKFLKFLVSESMQSSQNIIARPLNIKALENQSIYTVTGMTAEELKGKQLPEDYQKVYEDYVEKQKKIISKINTYAIRDAVIDYLIQKETAPYFEGSKTAKQVATDLQEKVQMYLNE